MSHMTYGRETRDTKKPVRERVKFDAVGYCGDLEAGNHSCATIPLNRHNFKKSMHSGTKTHKEKLICKFALMRQKNGVLIYGEDTKHC